MVNVYTLTLGKAFWNMPARDPLVIPSALSLPCNVGAPLASVVNRDGPFFFLFFQIGPCFLCLRERWNFPPGDPKTSARFAHMFKLYLRGAPQWPDPFSASAYWIMTFCFIKITGTLNSATAYCPACMQTLFKPYFLQSKGRSYPLTPASGRAIGYVLL